MDSPAPTPEEMLDNLLADKSLRKQRCCVCANDALARAIDHFLSLKDSGDPRTASLTLRWLYLEKLRDTFDGPETWVTIVKHLKGCRGREP